MPLIAHFKTWLETVQFRFNRHRNQPPRFLVHKASEFLASTASAQFYLRHVTHVGRRVRTIGKPRIANFGIMDIGDDVTIRSVHMPIELAVEPGAVLRIGNRCSINYGVSIGATERVELGQRVRVGPLSMIIDSAFHELYNRFKRPPSKPVFIEDDVWIGARAVIMAGVRIGRGSVVGTCAVVTKDVPPFTVVAGNPAKFVQSLDPELFVVPSDWKKS